MSPRVRGRVSTKTAFEPNSVLPSCVILRNMKVPQSTIFRRCTILLSALSLTSTLPVEQHAVAINQLLGLMQIVQQPSAGPGRSNNGIERLDWSAHGWPGPHRPIRSISCTEENRVNFVRRKSLTAGTIQRSCEESCP